MRYNIISKINETGLVNDMINSLEAVQETKNCIIAFFNRDRWNHDLCIFKHNSDCYMLINNRKSDDFDYDRLTLPREKRFTWTYSGGQGSIASYKLLTVLKDIINHQGETKETYIGLEANHLMPRVYKIVNSINNLELCDEIQNLRHFAAWRKLQCGQEYLPIKLSALNLELISDVLYLDTEIYRFNDKIVVRRPCQNGDIIEYICRPQDDGTWQFK